MLFIYLGIYSFYLFIFSLAGRLIKIKKPPVSTSLSRFVIYIYSYKEDEIILNSAANAITLDYPKDHFHVCVIADSLKPETIERLKKMPIQLLEVAFKSSTKCKALHKAIENTTRYFDAAIVFDADHICAPDFLYQVNNYLQAGHRAVQGHRVAKNTNTQIAVLDAVSEESNNHIFCRSQRVFNLSAAIIGSGMALEYRLFREVVLEIDAFGWFDKEMELLLTLNNIRIAYAEDAIIYEEKVSNAQAFKKQRRRRLSAWFNLLKEYGSTGLTQLLFHGNFDYFNKIYQIVALPSLLMLGLMPFMLIVCLIAPGVSPSWQLWLAATGCCYAGILIAVPATFLNDKLLRAVSKALSMFFTTMRLSLKLKGVNKRYTRTPSRHRLEIGGLEQEQ